MAKAKRLKAGDKIGEHFTVFAAKPEKVIPAGAFGRYSPSAVDPGWFEASADLPGGGHVTQFGHSAEALGEAVANYERGQASRPDGGVFGKKPISSKIKIANG